MDSNDPWAKFTQVSKPEDSWSKYQSATPNSAVDAVRSLPGGLAQGASAVTGIPGDVQAAQNWLQDKIGMDPRIGSILLGIPMPTSSTINKKVSDTVGGYYQPKTFAGHVAETAASFFPALAGGEASLATKLATRMLAPALGSEVAGAAAQGTSMEPVARIGGALAGGGIAAGLRKGIGAGVSALSPPTPEMEQDAAHLYVNRLAQSAQKTPEQVAQYGQEYAGRGATGAEALGPSGVSALAALGRRSGPVGEQLGTTLLSRQLGAPGRMMEDYSSVTGIDPAAARGDIRNLVKQGREEAAPLYQDAFAGGSVAPLADQFRSALTKATSAKGMIAKQIKAIEENNPGALSARGAAGADVRAKYMDLHDQLAQAEADRQSTLGMFQHAQEDIASNKPGAVWSPRIQQFLDDKVFQSGIGRGLEVQRLESLAKNRRFDPTEFAITGTDEAGKPLVGKVPNMRLLDAGKRGLDEMINDYVDPTTGRLAMNERVKALMDVRRSYLDELDNLNPSYKTARARAADYLSIQDAFNKGQKMVFDTRLPPSDFSDYFQKLSPPEQRGVLSGIANKLFMDAGNNRLNAKFSTIPAVQKKLTAAMGPEAASSFIGNLNKEFQLSKTGGRMAPGTNSITSDVLLASNEADNAAKIAGTLHAARAVGHAAGGNFLGAAQGGWSAARHFFPDLFQTGGMSPQVRQLAGNALMGPPEDLQQILERYKGLKPNQSLPQRIVAPLSVPILNQFSRQQ